MGEVAFVHEDVAFPYGLKTRIGIICFCAILFEPDALFFELERFIPFGVSARVDAAKKDIEFGS